MIFIAGLTDKEKEYSNIRYYCDGCAELERFSGVLVTRYIHFFFIIKIPIKKTLYLYCHNCESEVVISGRQSINKILSDY